MTILYMMIPITFLIAGTFVAAYIWAAKSGQFDDLVTPAHRALLDESENEIQPSSNRVQPTEKGLHL